MHVGEERRRWRESMHAWLVKGWVLAKSLGLPEHIKSTEDGNVCWHVLHVKRVDNSEQRS